MMMYLAILFIAVSNSESSVVIKFIKIENCTTTNETLHIERCDVTNGTLNVVLDVYKPVDQLFVSKFYFANIISERYCVYPKIHR